MIWDKQGCHTHLCANSDLPQMSFWDLCLTFTLFLRTFLIFFPSAVECASQQQHLKMWWTGHRCECEWASVFLGVTWEHVDSQARQETETDCKQESAIWWEQESSPRTWVDTNSSGYSLEICRVRKTLDSENLELQ